MISFFKTVVYVPLYNVLVWLIDVLPGADVGLAIIILTILVKLVLYPLSKKSSLTQLKMKEHEAELNQIKEKHKDQKDQALAVMEFYKKHGINPFSSFATIFIQIPIIYSLYYMFAQSGLPAIDVSLIYPFISAPAVISTEFLGLIDVAGKSLFLALLAGVSSFFQMRMASAVPQTNSTGSFGDALSKAMSLQMKFVLPIIVFFVSWRISGAIALYWFVSNITGLLQDRYIKTRFNTGKIN